MCSEKSSPMWRSHLKKWQATYDQSSVQWHLIQASPQCLGHHETFKRHLDQMGIPFDPGLCGAPRRKPFLSSGSNDRFMEGWEEVWAFLLPSFFSTHTFPPSKPSSLPPFIPILWPIGLSLVAAPHLEYMNKRLEEHKVLEDTELPLLEVNTSC